MPQDISAKLFVERGELLVLWWRSGREEEKGGGSKGVREGRQGGEKGGKGRYDIRPQVQRIPIPRRVSGMSIFYHKGEADDACDAATDADEESKHCRFPRHEAPGRSVPGFG